MDELDEIVETIKLAKCVPFLGAGISNIAGCSGWDSIPEKLELKPEIQSLLASGSALLPGDASKEQKIEIYSRELKRINKSYLYEQVIEEVINCNAEEVLRNYLVIVKAIEKIYSFSKLLMTTNIDNCLDLARGTKFVPPKARKYFKIVDFEITNLNNGGIFHIHGHRNDLEGTIFTEGALLNRYQDRGFANFLCHVFKTYTVLFIGYGLGDKLLMEIMEKMKDRQHFALTQVGKYTPAEKTNFIERYNIKIIEYPDHASLPAMMQQWVNNRFPELSAQVPEEEDATHAI